MLIIEDNPANMTLAVFLLQSAGHITALAMKGDEARIRAAGCDGYIAKPMRYQEFLSSIAAQLAQA